MKTPVVTTIDFETESIEARPNYPPKPVSVSIKRLKDKKPKFYSWGHPTENNGTLQDAIRALKTVWDSGDSLLFHNAKFDYDVATTHLGLKTVPWERIHDTLYLLFLHNPHALSLGLKESSELILKMPPEERDAVTEWLVKHTNYGTFTKKNPAAAYISKAPGKVVEPYANGDVSRTIALFEKLWPEIQDRGMIPAYDTERELMPILLEQERVGIRIDTDKLNINIPKYYKSMEVADAWIRKRLKTSTLNVDSNEELADALESSKVVTEFKYTEKGRRSVSKKNLTIDMYTDPQVAAAVGYRNALKTATGTFLKNWQVREHKGFVFTSWNQVRQAHGNDGEMGARTGRMSNTPPFMNIPKEFDKDILKPSFLDVLALPLCREYLLPDKGQIWGHRDYNQQEFRILGHYEDDGLLASYLADPRLDVHQWLKETLDAVGVILARKHIKIANFADIYGRGMKNQAMSLGVELPVIQRINAVKASMMPGLPRLKKEIKRLVRDGFPIRTWGGREYYVEPSIRIGTRMVHFDYKLLNYLIQGSAADMTKKAIINWHKHPKRQSRFLVTVHDEINMSMLKKLVKSEMQILAECMGDMELDCPMVSDGKVGPNWHALTKHKEDLWIPARFAA